VPAPCIARHPRIARRGNNAQHEAEKKGWSGMAPGPASPLLKGYSHEDVITPSLDIS
jgi:hypothetical protein